MPQVSHEQAELLAQIRVCLPEQTFARYDELIAKRRAETLTNEEYEELMRLTDVVEEDHARRIGLVAKLSKLRNVPVKSLMRELGIGPRQRTTAKKA